MLFAETQCCTHNISCNVAPPWGTIEEILAINTIHITTEQSCGTTLHEEMENTCKRYMLNKQHACAHHLPTSSVHFWRQQLIEQSLLP